MGEVIDNEDVEVDEILGAEHAVFWRSVTAKGSLADLTLFQSVARSLLKPRKEIRVHR